MPIKLPMVSGSLSMKFPFPDWLDSYTLMLDLFSLGWQQGYFELVWTHESAQDARVGVDGFTIQAADPVEQPVLLEAHAEDAGSSTPMTSLFPIVWVNGVTYLVFWSDWA
jgi:hypothetical protein